jgi:AP-3 complex subunit delta-1
VVATGTRNRMFRKNLTDLVKGIRAHSKDESRYIAAALQECKDELKQNDFELKAEAMLKLVHLQMHEQDISWAAFNCVECMASPIFRSTRLGYLVCSAHTACLAI